MPRINVFVYVGYGCMLPDWSQLLQLAMLVQRHAQSSLVHGASPATAISHAIEPSAGTIMPWYRSDFNVY
jgi:hypothetical protein